MYTECQQRWLLGLYLILILIWVAVIVVFELYLEPVWWILFLPLILFAIGIYNIDCITEEVENVMLNSSTLSVGLILALPLFTILIERYKGDRHRFTAILVLALVFTLLSILDVWVPPCWICLYHHWCSGLQVIGITLLIFALANFYSHYVTK